jgi:hypothetical protein
MKSLAVICLLSLLTVPMFAQSKDPVSDALRQMLGGRAKNTIAAFEAMPADKFGFKPTPAQMSYGDLAAHVVESNYYFCANVGNVPQPKMTEVKGSDSKDALVAAVKSSFDFCGTALTKASDSTMSSDITWFDGKPRARAWAFLGLASSLADHYGMAAIYLRLNGLLPPTAKKE